jgi:hypothetical protein
MKMQDSHLHKSVGGIPQTTFLRSYLGMSEEISNFAAAIILID